MVPLTAVSYIGASIGIAAFIAVSGFYRHKQHPDGVYGYAPSVIYAFMVMALILILLASSGLFWNYRGTWQADVVLYACALVAMVTSIYLKYAKIVISNTAITYSGILMHDIAFQHIVKIVEYGRIRRRHADIHTAKWTKQMSISGFITDFDDLMIRLRERCPNAEYIQKMN